MYQTHSTTFSGWQHYYHQRQANGPLFMKSLDFNEGLPNEDDAQEWINLWDSVKPKRGKTFNITAYDRCKPRKDHFLWEIVENIPMKNLVGWTFVFEDGGDQITIEYCTQISYVVEKLKPDEDDRRQYELIDKLMKKGEKEETLKKMKTKTLEDMLNKLTLKDDESKESEGKKGDESVTETDESDWEEDEQEEEKRLEKEKISQLKEEINQLKKDHYMRKDKQEPVSDSEASILTFVKRLREEVELRKEILLYKPKRNKLKSDDSKVTLTTELSDLKQKNTDAIAAGKAFNIENYSLYFKDKIEDYKVEGIVNYTKEDVQKLRNKLDPKVHVILQIREKDEKFTYSSDTTVKKLKKILSEKKEEAADREKENKLKKEAVEEANKFNAEKYGDYFTDVEDYDLEKITKEDTKTIKARMKVLGPKVTKIKKLRGYPSVEDNQRYDENTNFDAKIQEAKDAKKAAAKKARDDEKEAARIAREEEKARIAKEKSPIKTRTHVQGLFDPTVDINERYPLGLTGKVSIYTKKSSKTIDPLLLVQQQTMVSIEVPSKNFDLVHIESSKYDATKQGKYTIIPPERVFYDKKAVEVVQVGGEWFLQAVKPENVIVNADEKRGMQVPEKEPADVELNLNYKPRKAQNVTIRAVNDDMLISHAPGKGKTFTAILKAEKKRNELKKSDDDIPRILVLAPNAVLLKQWQKEVIDNKLDPRNYSFQTYNLFRNTFTTGRFPKWKDLDASSKAMITGDKGCWLKDSKGIWYWNGDMKSPNVEEYYNEKINKDDLDKMFWPLLTNRKKNSINTRKDLKNTVFATTNRGKKGKQPVYIQDTVTNKYLRAASLFRDGQNIREPANFKGGQNKTEYNVLATIERRKDFYLLHQEDIFLHHSPTEDDPFRYYFFTNLKLSQRINKILENEEDLKEQELEEWIKKQNSYPSDDDIFKRKEEIEKAYQKRRDKQKAENQENENTAGDQDTDKVEGLDAYGGKVPFTRRNFKGESEDGSDYGAYDASEFITFLQDSIRSRIDVLYHLLPRDIKNAINGDKLNKYDVFRDLSRALVQSDDENRIQSKIIDKFINPQHGKDLSQHRYQVDPSDSIVILDEAHDKEAITDNLYKVSTKVVFEFLKNSVMNLFVTATPMQSEKPMVQLWLFSEGLKKNENGERMGIEDIKDDWIQRKVDAEEKVKEEEEERKEKAITLNTLQKKKLRRRRKYEEKFDVAYSIAKKISRSFEMQPTARKLFLNSVLSDIYFHEALPMVLKLDRRMHTDPSDRFSYFDNLTIATKNAILRKIGESKFAVKEGDDFENPFPKKMRLLTPYDKGFMRSYMDEVRMNVCRYAERDKNKVYYDYTTRNATKKYANDKRYDSYATGRGIGPSDQNKNFNIEMSEKLFERCKFRCIPFVINRCKESDELNASECKEIDGRLMKKLQEEAFNYNDNNTFQPLLVPVLADSVDEAWDYLGRVMIKSYRQNVKRGVARASRTLPSLKDLSKDRSDREVFVKFVKDCKEKMKEQLNNDDFSQIFEARWMHYEPNRKGIMPYIPNLMSSKYKDICELLLKKDREHVNGILYHPNYQVHYQLGHTLMAHGARKFDASDLTFLKTNEAKQFKANAKKKILKKWDAYSELYFFHHSNRKEDNPKSVQRKWTPTYEIERLQNWGEATEYYKSRFHEEEDNKSKATEELHTLINELGKELEEALEASPEWEQKPLRVKKRRKINGRKDEYEVREVEQKFWFKKKNLSKEGMIEYVKYNQKETEFSMYLEKVYRLKGPVIRSDFGKYYALDDDDSEVVLYEGRNGRDGNGPSGDYQGPIVEPATKMEYIYYVTTKLGLTDVWQAGTSGSDIRPSFGKTTLQKKADIMVSFSLESYDKTLNVDHDKRYDDQQKIRKLMRRAEKLVINDYYSSDDGEKTVKEYLSLMNDAKEFENSYFQKNKNDKDFNHKLNKILMKYIYLYVKVKPANYKNLYPNRAFSQLEGLEYLDSKVESNTNYKKEIAKELEDILNSLPTANKKRDYEEKGRPRYITKELVDFLQQDDVRNFLKVNDRVIEKLKKLPKPKKYLGSKKEKADKLLEALEGGLFQNVDTQKDRKELFENIEALADANFALDIEEKVENFNTQPTLENLLALKHSPYLKDYYASSRTWKYTSPTKKKDIVTKRKANMNNDELFEKVWEKKGVEIIETSLVEAPLLIRQYFEQKYKNLKLPALQEEAVKNKIETTVPASRGNTKNKTGKQLKKELVAKMIEDTPSIANSDLQKEITKAYYDARLKEDKAYGKTLYMQTTGKNDIKKTISSTKEIDFTIIPELTYTWYRRKFLVEDGEVIYSSVDDDNYKEVPSNSSSREGTNYQPYQCGDETNGINLTKNRKGLRVETVPSSQKTFLTFEAMEKRHRALNSDTFISFMYYNAKDTGGIQARDLVKQAHEAGLIDFLIMSGAGITGVDLQSTRQSLMVMVQPSKSPGLKDQFVGRLIRNMSHGIIPHKFQRVEHVTFFNSLRLASDGTSFSRQAQPWPLFNDKDFQRLKDENEEQRFFRENNTEETQADRDFIDPPSISMDLDDLLEEDMLYEGEPRRGARNRTQTARATASEEQRKEYEEAQKEKKRKKEEYDKRKNDAVEALERLPGGGSLSKKKLVKFAVRYFREGIEWQNSSKEAKAWDALLIWKGPRHGRWNMDDVQDSALAKIEKEDAESEDEDDELYPSSDEDVTPDDNQPPAEKEPKSTKRKKKEEKEKARAVGGNLDKLVDSQIDNHINVSAVITVGNHAFTTVQQYVNSDFKSVISKESDTEKAGKFEKPVKVDFGFCCYNCHYENKMEAVTCEVCGTKLDDRYYKLMEYPILEQILNTEVAWPKLPLYPLGGGDGETSRDKGIKEAWEKRSLRYMKPDGQKLRDAWTRQEAMLWHYKTGFFAKLVERNQLRYLLSMVTVEHYFKEQKDEVKEYTYNVGSTNGTLYVRTKTEEPYGWENRLKTWYEVVYPNRDFNSTTSTDSYGQKESSDIEFEYLSEYESDIESEYSD